MHLQIACHAPSVTGPLTPSITISPLGALLTLGACILLAAAPAGAAAQTGTLRGRVVDASSATPIAEAQVVVTGTRQGALTDSSGRFVISDVPSGALSLAATRIGYATDTLPVRVGTGQVVEVQIRLAERAVTLGSIEVVGRRGGVVASNAAVSTKMDEPLLETPQSVSVITGAQLELQQIGTIAEAARYTAGIQAEPWGFEPRFTFLQIRGFDATTTGLYRDGLQLRNPSWTVGDNLEPYGAERIEVVRGPASVLYGAGSPGGLVNYIAKRPTSVPLRQVEIDAGSHDRLQGKLDLSGPIGDAGKLGYRITSLVRESDTQVDFVGNDRVFVAPALTWSPTAHTTLTLLGHFKHDKTRSSQALPADGVLTPNPNGAIPIDRFTGEPGVDRYDRTDYNGGYILEHTAGSMHLRQNLRYYDVELDDITVYTTGLRPDARTIDRAYYSSLGDASGLAVDNHAQLDISTGGISQRLMAGLDFQRITAASVQAFTAAPPLDIFDPQYGQPIPDVAPFVDNVTRQRQLGLYLQDRIEIGPHWVVSLAGRHDWARNEVRDHLTDSRTSQDDAAFTFRGGILFNSTTGLAPYFSYAESFLPTVGVDAEGKSFDPERGRQYELGVKYAPSSWNGFITVSLFDLTRRNYLQYDPESFLPEQTGEARSRGVEAEAVAGLLTGLNLRGALTMMDVEVTRSDDPTELGRRPAQTPDRLASLWLDYTVMSGKLSGLGAGAGVRYLGATFGDAQNTIDIPSVTLADAEAFYDWRDLRFAVNVQNLFDKRYVASAFARTSLLATFGPARSITTSIRYRW